MTPFESAPLRAMTFNLLVNHPSSTLPWPGRRSAVAGCIREAAPDIIGTQEGLFTQVQDVASACAEYDWLGIGRDGGSRGEYMAIFYRRARLELLEYNHFWLSDTPEVMGSTTWGNRNIRMVTWGKFRDRHSNREFYFWNTHLDHEIQEAREKGAALVAQRVSELRTNLPVILVGDFNAIARENRAHEILTTDGRFTDTWFTAARRLGPDYATFHGFRPPVLNGGHIDWILTQGPIRALETAVITFREKDQYPSDHFPVLANLVFGEQ